MWIVGQELLLWAYHLWSTSQTVIDLLLAVGFPSLSFLVRAYHLVINLPEGGGLSPAGSWFSTVAFSASVLISASSLMMGALLSRTGSTDGTSWFRSAS